MTFVPSRADLIFHRQLAKALGITVEALYAQAGVDYSQIQHANSIAHRFTSETGAIAALRSQATGRAHRFSSTEASEAGQIGGRRPKRKPFSPRS